MATSEPTTEAGWLESLAELRQRLAECDATIAAAKQEEAKQEETPATPPPLPPPPPPPPPPPATTTEFACGVRITHVTKRAQLVGRFPLSAAFGVRAFERHASVASLHTDDGAVQEDARALRELAERSVEDSDEAQLRSDLQRLQHAMALRQSALKSKLPQAEASFRAGHLRALPYFIGQPPSDRSWRDEWGPLREAFHQQQYDLGHSESVASTESVAELKTRFATAIEKLTANGWKEEHAISYSLISACREPIGRALVDKDIRYAASTYALSEALWCAPNRNARRVREQPLCMYFHRFGPYSLAEAEPGWTKLEEYDAAGFRGVISHAMTRMQRRRVCFATAGFVYKALDRMLECDCDIVCFESRPDDEHGAHSIIPVDEEGEVGALPPNTLFRLQDIKSPGSWEAPGGVRPMQRLLIVTATYQRPWRGVDADGEGIARGGAKFCGTYVTLRYDNSEAFANGLDDLISCPLLRMEDEFHRDLQWTDWKGVSYSAREEWAYVTGVARRTPGCSMGVRDEEHDGLRHEDFEARARHFVEERRARGCGLRLPLAHAFLSRDEVLAVRLYTGPAYQPINTFLRQIAALTGAHRREMARHPGLTFAATVGHLCRAVRKLAAVATDEEARRPLWRNVRGELPRSFWTPDEQGLVCATDLAFFSTSRDEAQPLAYMQEGGKNVLWELEAQPENDTGYHVGADVELLSQFAHEKEVLFPPCTLLKVHPRKSRAASTPAPEEATAGAVAPGAAVPEAASTDTAPLRPFRSASGPAAPGTDPAPRDRFSLSRSKTLEPFHADEVTRVDPKNPSRVFEVLKVKVLPEFL